MRTVGRSLWGASLLVAVFVTLPACPSSRAPDPVSEEREDGSFPALAPRQGPLVVFLGDSLTAGYGVGAEVAFPAVVEQTLEERGQPIRALNAGVSGDTTAGGLSRIDWLLRQEPQVLVLELGANDGLRGLPLEETESNLEEMIQRAQEAGAEVLLLGMLLPPNYGRDYAEGFAAIFPRLAQKYDLALVDFLLDGVAADPDLNLPDGIHPTPEGHTRAARNVVPELSRLLARLPSPVLPPN